MRLKLLCLASAKAKKTLSSLSSVVVVAGGTKQDTGVAVVEEQAWGEWADSDLSVIVMRDGSSLGSGCCSRSPVWREVVEGGLSAAAPRHVVLFNECLGFVLPCFSVAGCFPPFHVVRRCCDVSLCVQVGVVSPCMPRSHVVGLSFRCSSVQNCIPFHVRRSLVVVSGALPTCPQRFQIDSKVSPTCGV